MKPGLSIHETCLEDQAEAHEYYLRRGRRRMATLILALSIVAHACAASHAISALSARASLIWDFWPTTLLRIYFAAAVVGIVVGTSSVLLLGSSSVNATLLDSAVAIVRRLMRRKNA